MYSESKPTATGYPASTAQPYPAPPPGAAYPYPPPSYYPQTNPNPNPYYNNPATAPRRRFLRLFLFGVIAVFVVVGLSTFITWLVLRPRLPEFSISSASVSSFNLSSNQLSSNFELNFSVSNPNKKLAVYYDGIRAGVLYDFDTIALTSLPPFSQSTRTSSIIPASFSAVAEYVNDDVVKGIRKERESRGAVDFDVRFYSWVNFRSGSWRTRTRRLSVRCDGVRIGLNSTASSGALMGAPTQCQVYI